MSIFAAFLSLCLPPLPRPLTVDGVIEDIEGAVVARIEAAPDHATLDAELSRLPALSPEGWARCQGAMMRRLAELSPM